jgi:hypothetical protein
VLFINADREYREGKAQNHLRPEDIDKIVHAYRAGQNIDGYAKRVPVADIKAEDYNCNIRRYVDNAPPPEPHDVRAHLHGGVPVSEIDALATSGRTTPACAKACFVPRATATHGIWYADFAAGTGRQARHRPAHQQHPGVTAAPRPVHDRVGRLVAGSTCRSSRRWHRMPTTSTPPAATSTPFAPRCWTASSARSQGSTCSTAIRCAALSPTTTSSWCPISNPSPPAAGGRS